MKNLYSIFIVLIIVLICGCSSQNSSSKIDNAYDEGYDNGYIQGYEDGSHDAGDSDSYHEGYQEGYNDALSDAPDIIGEKFRSEVADLEDKLEAEEGMTPEKAVKIATWYAEGEYVDPDELQQALWVLRYYFIGLEDLFYDISHYTID